MIQDSFLVLLFAFTLRCALSVRAAVNLIGGNDPTEVNYAELYGTCPEQNAVCVAIRFRNPKPSDDCTEGCHEVASRLTTTLGPGQDEKFPSGCGRCVEMDERSGQQHWAYDVVFPYDDTTEETAPNADVYNGLVKPMLSKAFGCEKPGGACQSAAFFAYGASGSGKSFTMGFEKDKKDGMLQLGSQQMFESLERLQGLGHPLGNQKVYMAFYELYGAESAGSRVFDLLGKGKTKGLGMRGSQSEVLCSLSFKHVGSLEKMIEVFNNGNRKRAVGGTGMNAVSSRSHAVVQFFLSKEPIDVLSKELLDGKKAGRSKLLGYLQKSVQVMFVDLAGSEPAGKWDDKKRVAEGIAINTALSALRQCIASAADPKANKCSTRADMLTEMLKNLFDKDKRGRAKSFTTMLATFNPSADPNQMVLSKGTMQYASTVKKIKIKTPSGLKVDNIVKVTPEQVIAQLKTQMMQLEAENNQLKAEMASLKDSPAPEAENRFGEEEVLELRQLVHDLTLTNERLTGEAARVTELEEENLGLRSQKEALEAQVGAHEAKVSDLTEENRRLTVEAALVPELTEQVKELRSTTKDLEEVQLSEALTAAQEASTKLAAATAELGVQKEENAALAAEIKEARKVAQQAEEASIKLQAQIEALTRSNAFWQGKVEAAEATVKEMKDLVTEANRAAENAVYEKRVIEAVIVEKQGSLDMCEDEKASCESFLAEAESKSELAISEQRACAERVTELLQEVQEFQARTEDPAVLEARKETACSLSVASEAALVHWDSDQEIRASLEQLQDLAHSQEERRQLIKELKTLLWQNSFRIEETIFSAWIGDRVDALLTPGTLNMFQRHLLKIPKAIEMVEEKVEEVSQDQERLLEKITTGVDAFWKSLSGKQPDKFDEQDFASKRFAQMVTRLGSSIDHVTGNLATSLNPASEFAGLEQQIVMGICSSIPLLRSQGGGEQECPEKDHTLIKRICLTIEGL